MSRTSGDARRWTADGTALFVGSVARLNDATYAAPSLLPGWTRRHLVAHVAANAGALCNLVRWAATGVPTPMYASPAERAAGIERGTLMSAAELGSWARRSAVELGTAMDSLTDEQWEAEVVTAQGRSVPATEVAWLRAREVWVHTVDLGLDIGFADLPEDFLVALCADVVAKRGDVPAVDAPLDRRAAWLTGRDHGIADAPELGAWL
jgi:maleylpyruvate isomerase